MEKDYYKILGIEKNASKEELKKAYRALAHQYHPDKKGGDEKKFKEINEAYQILSDDIKRARYDRFGSNLNQEGAGFEGFGQDGATWGGNINEIFEEFFGGGFGGQWNGTRSRAKNRGQDIAIDVELSLEEAFRGLDHHAQLKKFIRCARCQGSRKEPDSSVRTCPTCNGKGQIQEIQKTIFGSFKSVRTCPECQGEGQIIEKPCKECRGSGRIQTIETITFHIPAGIAEGELIRVLGKGEMGIGGEAGDLYARIYIKKHSLFIRKGSDLYSTVTIPVSLGALGGEKNVQIIDGMVKLEIPSGVQSGTLLNLKGKGMPRAQKESRGNHFVQIVVETPKKLSRRAKELFKELEREGM